MYPKANGVASHFRCVHDRHKKISDDPVKSDVFPFGYLGFLWCLGCKLPKEALYSRRGFIPLRACRITTLCKQKIGSYRFWCSGKE
ncbi:hypothetical protein Hdeb2414_s0564g00917481 [Helianthus debilis subsp. tardiflorus]